jgi:methylthioribose-1-phosphate isomerase
MTSVEWVAGKVRFIDQTRLPAEEVMVETSDYHVVGDAIKKLKIRGAPAIGVAAAFAVLLPLEHNNALSPKDAEEEFLAAIDFLSGTRPTAVNLFIALNRMRRAFAAVRLSDVSTIRRHLLEEACRIQKEDIEACRKIGEYGAALIPPGSSILTHCNTGALATAGEGTAQSIITTAFRQNKVVHVFADETRPLFQGARLTSWELLRQNIDVTLITDSTAGYLMQQKQVNAVLVGADRIAANGDTANKIGTYSLAVLAQHHAIPLYVAAPTSTIDVKTTSGSNIPVELRSDEEITHVAGVRIAAQGVKVYAPAFDVTPHDLIAAIVTEKGVLRSPYDEAIAALHLEPSQHGPGQT